MPIHLTEIRAFLNRPGAEGPQHLRGYIPSYRKSDGKGRNYIGPHGTNPGEVKYPSTGSPTGFTAMGVSGVTIATGVDLGQTNSATLVGAGLDRSIAEKFRPYFGQTKDNALRALFDAPLVITRAEADAVDDVTIGIHVERISTRYNRDNPVTPFEDLPPQAQTAIFSLLYQRGTGVAGKEQEIWASFQHGEWDVAEELLCDADHWTGGQAQYLARRKMEGELLREIV